VSEVTWPTSAPSAHGHTGLQLVTRAMTSDASKNQRADPGDQAPRRRARGSPGRPTSSGRPPQCRQAPRSGGSRAANGGTPGFVRRSRRLPPSKRSRPIRAPPPGELDATIQAAAGRSNKQIAAAMHVSVRAPTQCQRRRRFGHFEVMTDVSQYTKAAAFQPGTKKP